MEDQPLRVGDDESLLRFPCDFPIKVMGANGQDLRRLVVELVRHYAPELDEGQVQVRESRTGRYQSVTVIVPARDREQLESIYQVLSTHPQIAFVL